MRLQFRHQKFQSDAATAVCDVFAGQLFHAPTYMIDPGLGQIEFFASELDKSLMESPQNWIPESVLPYVRNVVKKSVTFDGHVKAIYRKLWLFSESEMFGSAIYSLAEDGKRYEAFATSENRVAYDGNGSACAAWLRSAYANHSNYFCVSSATGSATAVNAGCSFGVELGFCV